MERIYTTQMLYWIFLLNSWKFLLHLHKHKMGFFLLIPDNFGGFNQLIPDNLMSIS